MCILANKANLNGIWDLPVLKHLVLCCVMFEYLGNNDNLNTTDILCFFFNLRLEATDLNNNFLKYHLINKIRFNFSIFNKFNTLTFLLKFKNCI